LCRTKARRASADRLGKLSERPTESGVEGIEGRDHRNHGDELYIVLLAKAPVRECLYGRRREPRSVSRQPMSSLDGIHRKQTCGHMPTSDRTRRNGGLPPLAKLAAARAAYLRRNGEPFRACPPRAGTGKPPPSRLDSSRKVGANGQPFAADLDGWATFHGVRLTEPPEPA